MILKGFCLTKGTIETSSLIWPSSYASNRVKAREIWICSKRDKVFFSFSLIKQKREFLSRWPEITFRWNIHRVIVLRERSESFVLCPRGRFFFFLFWIFTSVVLPLSLSLSLSLVLTLYSSYHFASYRTHDRWTRCFTSEIKTGQIRESPFFPSVVLYLHWHLSMYVYACVYLDT